MHCYKDFPAKRTHCICTRACWKSHKWRRHGWRAASGEVGHGDLLEQILWEWERAGEEMLIHWVSSHFRVGGQCKGGSPGGARPRDASKQYTGVA